MQGRCLLKQFFLYQHGGSGNHGCEALVRTVTGILKQTTPAQVTLCSNDVAQDKAYGLEKEVGLLQNEQILRRWSPKWFLYQLDKRITHSAALQEKCLVEQVVVDGAKKADVAIAIGGDNYCYNKGRQFWPTDRRLKKDGNPVVLWGCSIEPKDLDEEFVRQLSYFDRMTVRESISYEAMKQAGIPEEKIRLIPDPAFTLEAIEKPLPEGFAQDNTVGSNVSPMIIGCEEEKGAAMSNYENLMRHILDTTDFHIALIPHVVWSYNDDRQPLKLLYEKFKASGRVVLLEDADCRVLKGYIARLRLFIGARTHSTIAAYSTCVPTLVVGYSVKAEGIAKDLFEKGFSAADRQHFVLPVQKLRQPDELTRAFDWLQENEVPIRQHLAQMMPAYREKAYEAGQVVMELLR